MIKNSNCRSIYLHNIKNKKERFNQKTGLTNRFSKEICYFYFSFIRNTKMDLAGMNVLLDAPPVTKAWISSVIVVASLSYLSYIDVDLYVYFTSYKQLLANPLKILVSLCYCGQLNLLKLIDIYQMLGFLSDLETLHTRSTKHFLIKIVSMLALILIFHQFLPLLIAPRFLGYDLIFPRNSVSVVYSTVFSKFSLWDVLILNFIYYKSRFEGIANFNNWFNVHPVLLCFMNFFTISNKINWKTLLLFILPGHTLYYLDTIVPRIYKYQTNKTFGASLAFSFFVWLLFSEYSCQKLQIFNNKKLL